MELDTSRNVDFLKVCLLRVVLSRAEHFRVLFLSGMHTGISAPESSCLWFTDGNLILIAEPSGVRYKVHRGMLERHSEVFRDLFTLATPDTVSHNETEKDEPGCVSVQVYDRSRDWACLLSALYDGL